MTDLLDVPFHAIVAKPILFISTPHPGYALKPGKFWPMNAFLPVFLPETLRFIIQVARPFLPEHHSVCATDFSLIDHPSH